MTRRRARPGPSLPTMLARGLTMACPACGRRSLFRRWFIMAEDCPRCGLHFERIEGHWIGAIGINTIVSFALLGIVVIVGAILTYPDGSVLRLVLVAIAVAIAGPTLFYPMSKTLWTAIDLGMRPLEAHEVDWTQVEESLGAR